MIGRIYVWLICHNVCACALGHRLHLPGRAQMFLNDRCADLEDRYLGPGW